MYDNKCGICDSEYNRKVGWYGKSFYCSNCQTIYTPLYDESIYNEIYRDRYIRYEESPENDPIQKCRWELIQNYAAEGDILDIGCGVGAFLKVAPEEFKVTGHDINTSAAEHVRNLGIECYSQYKNVMDYNKFDIITMWDVIEHIPDFDLLRTVRESIKPGGYFIFCTPNFNLEDHNPDKIEDWKHYRPYEHVWNFSNKSIEALTKKLSFEELVKIDYTESAIRLPERNIATYILQK